MLIDTVGKINIFCGKRNSGKSILMKYMIEQSMEKYKKVYLISPSEKINKFYSDIIKNEQIYDEYNEGWVNSLIEKMTKVNEGKTSKNSDFINVLLILDDCGSDTNFHSSRSLNILVSRGRHLGITLYIAIQHLNCCAPICRENSDYIFVGKLSRNSLELLLDNYQTGEIDKKDFIKMYNKATLNYSFLVIFNNATVDNCLNNIYSSIKVPFIE